MEIITFQSTPDMIDAQFVHIKAFDTSSGKLLLKQRVPQRVSEEWKHSKRIELTALLIDKAIKQRHQNYRYANYTDARVQKAFNRLADLSRSLYSFSSHSDQLDWIQRVMLPWLNDIAPRNPTSYPSFHKLIGQLQNHGKATAQPVT